MAKAKKSKLRLEAEKLFPTPWIESNRDKGIRLAKIQSYVDNRTTAPEIEGGSDIIAPNIDTPTHMANALEAALSGKEPQYATDAVDPFVNRKTLVPTDKYNEPAGNYTPDMYASGSNQILDESPGAQLTSAFMKRSDDYGSNYEPYKEQNVIPVKDFFTQNANAPISDIVNNPMSENIDINAPYTPAPVTAITRADDARRNIQNVKDMFGDAAFTASEFVAPFIGGDMIYDPKREPASEVPVVSETKVPVLEGPTKKAKSSKPASKKKSTYVSKPMVDKDIANFLGGIRTGSPSNPTPWIPTKETPFGKGMTHQDRLNYLNDPESYLAGV